MLCCPYVMHIVYIYSRPSVHRRFLTFVYRHSPERRGTTVYGGKQEIKQKRILSLPTTRQRSKPVKKPKYIVFNRENIWAEKSSSPLKHHLRRRTTFSTYVSIYSLGKKVSKQHSEVSISNTVQSTAVHLWRTQPIKQPQHRPHGNSRPQRTQLLLSFRRDSGRSRAKETNTDAFLKT